MRALVVGAGYVGTRLAAALVRLGHDVSALRRTNVADAELKAAGVLPLAGDITDLATLKRLPTDWDWIINAASSSRGGPKEYEDVFLHGTENLLAWLSGSKVQKFVYTSSTSVYGQCDGSTVDETSPTEPQSPTGRILTEAERLLLKATREKAFPAVSLRVAGIYGPDRGHLFLQYLRGEAKSFGTGETFVNMIHVDDVVGAIIAALERGKPGETYNVADDEPVTHTDFFAWLSQTLNRPMPPILPESERPAKKRGVTNKRVLNQKLKHELGYRLKYPNFRTGYAAEIRRLGIFG